MFPVLLKVGPVFVSSFGFFLALGFLSAVFIAWRLAKVYDLSEGKILDLCLLTFFGGLIFARAYFAILNWDLFGDLGKVVLLNRYPGLSFWGGFLGGILTLRLFTLRAKFNFWQIADFAAVSFALGAFWGDLGCFLGGCGYGAPSSLLIATPILGLIGRRFPISLIESFLFLAIFFYLYKQVVRFHFNGKIASIFLIILAILKITTEPLRGDSSPIPFLGGSSQGYIFSLVVLIAGMKIFYRQSKRGFLDDLKDLARILSDGRKRYLLLQQFKKSWYNHWINWRIKIGRFISLLQTLPKNLKRRLNVRATPKNFR